MLKGLVEIGKSNRERYSTLLKTVTDIVRSHYPPHILAVLSVYGLFTGISSSGKLTVLQKSKKLSQADVELVQALALQQPKQELSGLPALPKNIQELFDILPDLSQSFGLQRLIQIEKEKSDQEKSVVVLQEHLRIHTQNVRNWGYYKRVISISKQLYQPLDDIFQKQFEVSATDIIKVFEILSTKSEKYVTDRSKKFRSIFAQETVEGVVQQYHALYPDLQGTADRLIEYAKSSDLTADNIKAILLSHSDFTLMNDLIFTVESLADDIGLPNPFPITLLDKLSYSFGDLAQYNPEQFFLDNPVWRRPLIKLDGGKFFCAIPQVFFSFIFQIFDELASNNDQIRIAIEKRRSQFLEAQVLRLFTASFPQCKYYSNYKWRENDKVYENDLLVLVDSHLILVEAKSGTISRPALRGAPDRAKRHVGELIYEPSMQSLRLKDRIELALAKPLLIDSLLPGFPFPLNKIKNILRLSVTLEDFAVLQSNLKMLKDAGWIEKNHPVAPCIMLADLEIVFDILESTSQKIYYIKRRTELEANMKHSADELDLLGFYLHTGFNIGETEFSGQHVQLVAFSEKIDEYYTSADNGIQRKKPSPKLTKWWKDILNRMEARGFHQWTDTANIILSLSFEEQVKATTSFKKIKKNVFKNWRQKNHLCSVIMIPTVHRSSALALYAFRDREKEKRHQRMKNIADQIFENDHVNKCAILGINVDEEDYPYSSVAVYFAEENMMSEV
jgi:hypothetical protein